MTEKLRPCGLSKSDTIEDALRRADQMATPKQHSGAMCSNKDLRRIVLLAYEHRRLIRQLFESEARVKDWKEVDDAHKRLVRELDVLLNGKDGAAQQASLCDIVSQVKHGGLSFARVKELENALTKCSDHSEDSGFVKLAVREVFGGREEEQ